MPGAHHNQMRGEVRRLLKTQASARYVGPSGDLTRGRVRCAGVVVRGGNKF